MGDAITNIVNLQIVDIKASNENNEWYNVSNVYETPLVIENTYKDGLALKYGVYQTCLGIIENTVCIGWLYTNTNQMSAAVLDLKQ